MLVNTTHLREFYNNSNNSLEVYNAPQLDIIGGAEGHAVLLVGYDNEQRYWVVKNSWGDTWADGGYFKVTVSACRQDLAAVQCFGALKLCCAARSVLLALQACCYQIKPMG